MQEFKKKYNLEERQVKSARQIKQNPGKLPIIAEPTKGSKLPPLKNPKFLCEDNYQFNTVSSILGKKIGKIAGHKNQAAFSVFIFAGGKHLVNKDFTVSQIYDKFKDQDGFLYITYNEYEAYG